MADRSLYIELIIDDQGAAKKLAIVDDAVRKIGTSAGPATRGLTDFEKSIMKGSAAGAFLAETLYDLSSRAVSAVVHGLGAAVTVASNFQATFIGLSTVAGAFGQSVDGAKSAAMSLASDGLLSVQEAAGGLKNLLASGFGLPEAIQLMIGFKDIAAFNRQASLGFGQAVVTATEGIKNQNSILVDNAGLTKNLSVIMKEAGLSVSDLARVSSDAGVRAKFLGGLLKEMGFAAGDAARMGDTYSGSVARMQTSSTLLQKEIGDRLMPAFKLGADVLGGFLGVAAQFPKTFMAVAGALTTAAGLAAGYGAWVIYGSTLTKVGAAFVTLAGQATAAGGAFTAMWAALTGPVGLVTAGLGAVALGLVAIVKHSADARLAAVTAATVTELLGKASAIAGRQITDVAEAEKIVNREWERKAELGRAARVVGEQYAASYLATGKAIRSEAMSQNVLREREATYMKEIGQLSETTLRNIYNSTKSNTMSTKDWVEALQKVGVTVGESSLKQYVDNMDAAKKKTDEATAATTKFREEQERAARAWADALTESQYAIAEAKYVALGQGVEAIRLSSQSDKTKDLFNQLLNANPTGTFDGLRISGGMSRGAEVQNLLMSAIVPGKDFARAANQGLSDALRSVFDGVGDTIRNQLGPAILGAVQGGGSVGGAMGGLLGGALTKNLIGPGTQAAISGVLGKTLGGAIGSIVPGLGTLIGSVGGQLLSKLVGGLFGGQGKAANDLRDKLLDSAGGFDKVAAAAAKAGVAIEPLLQAKNPKAVEAAWKTLTAAMEEYEKKAKEIQRVQDKYKPSWEDFTGAVRDQKLTAAVRAITDEFDILTKEIGVDSTRAVVLMKDEIFKLSLAAVRAGEEIPAAFLPWLRQLAEAGELTEEMAAQLLGMTQIAVPSYKEIEAAAERYGIKLEHLGTGAKQIWSNETAAQMMSDFTMLLELGTPVDTLMGAMSGKMSELVQRSIEWGLEIPEAMRPILQRFVESGQLVDANGDKLKDLSGINFAEPIAGAIDRLILKLDELIAAIDDTSTAASDIASGIPDNPFENWEIPHLELPSYDPGMFEPAYMHKGGAVDYKRAHNGLAIDEVPIIAQRGEGILSRRAMRDIGGTAGLTSLNQGGGSRGGLSIGDVTVHVGNARSEDELADAVGRALVRKMRRQGVRFNPS